MNSADYAKLASISFDQWVNRVMAGKYSRDSVRGTSWYKAGRALEAETHPVTPPKPPGPPAQSAHGRQAKYVLFAAQEPEKALGTPAKYAIAFSADQAYRHPNLPGYIRQYRESGHRVVGWCDCRPAPDGTPASVGVRFVADFGLDYFIGQCEDAAQFDDALSVGATVMVGNITALRQDQVDKIVAGEVFLIQEDYWNEGWARSTHPAITAYCAGIYPASWNPTIQAYKDAGRWRDGDGLYHVATVQDWANLP